MLFVAGIDEAGRGPLAGPVTAACVVLPPKFDGSMITDSKKLSAAKRKKCYHQIINDSLAYQIISVGHCRVDHLNIRQATITAMSLAAKRVAQKLQTRFKGAGLSFLIDGDLKIDTLYHQEPIVKGDSKILAISAASILAKVTRDNLMGVLDKRYPGYGFSGHKGYPTVAHKKSIKEKGPSRVHRKTFSGVREFVTRQVG